MSKKMKSLDSSSYAEIPITTVLHMWSIYCYRILKYVWHQKVYKWKCHENSSIYLACRTPKKFKILLGQIFRKVNEKSFDGFSQKLYDPSCRHWLGSEIWFFVLHVKPIPWLSIFVNTGSVATGYNYNPSLSITNLNLAHYDTLPVLSFLVRNFKFSCFSVQRRSWHWWITLPRTRQCNMFSPW